VFVLEAKRSGDVDIGGIGGEHDSLELTAAIAAIGFRLHSFSGLSAAM